MYAIVVKKRAEKEIAALPQKGQKRIMDAFDILRQNPFVGKKLEGNYEGAWTFRVWPYRIIYTINRQLLIVEVLRIVYRKGINS